MKQQTRAMMMLMMGTLTGSQASQQEFHTDLSTDTSLNV